MRRPVYALSGAAGNRCEREVSPIARKPAELAESAHHEALGLTGDDLIEMYRIMALARALDDRAKILRTQGKTTFTVTGAGQEAASIGAAWALRKGSDWALPYYRDTGAALVLGMSPFELMLNEFAKRDDPNGGGRQMPKHFGYRRLKIVSHSSPVGTQIPHAVGIALASKMRAEDAVTWVSFGEGAASTGDFHEAMNFAAIHKCPVVFFCHNNQYAYTVPMSLQSPVPQVSRRAPAYAMPGVSVDGNDILAVYEAVKDAVTRARNGDGPSLVEALTYRLDPHTSNDDGRHRPAAEVEEWRKKDPLPRLAAYLQSQGVAAEDDIAQLDQEAKREALEAAAKAEAAPDPDPATALRYVYAEGDEA